jgi:SAM-dependent methyltransferase
MLEVGCGTGAKTAVYGRMPRRPQAVGCDTDEESLQFGRRLLADAPQIVRSMPYVLPFCGSTFDLVLCEEVLEHVEEPAHLLAEIRRILTPGGRALFLIGPLYLHAKGPHLQHALNLMWPHLLLSHSTLAKLLRALPSPPGLLRTERTIAVFESLNKLGEADYLKVLRGSGLHVESARREAEYLWLTRLPLVGRLYRKSIRAVLRKPCASP